MLIFNLGGAGIKKFELHASECDEGIVLLFVYTISLWCVDPNYPLNVSKDNTLANMDTAQSKQYHLTFAMKYKGSFVCCLALTF